MRTMLVLCCVFVASCKSPLIATVIIGSAESPDPVLERVVQLEEAGVISGVVIMESFPVQIRLMAPQQIIDELEAMPRVESPGIR